MFLSSCSKSPPAISVFPPAELLTKGPALRQYPSDPSFGATVTYTIKLQDDYKECMQKDNALVDWDNQYFKVKP